MSHPKLVVFGGGTGSFTLLQSLKELTPHITAIVNMCDDGGSTGVLRDELGVLPPGDARQCLVALSETPDIRELFNYRFSDGSLQGQSLGNLILSGLELQQGGFEKAVETASSILRITGEVLPVVLGNHTLELTDGAEVIRHEHVIDNYEVKTNDVRVALTPDSTLNPKAEQAILAADMIVIAPGSLYTSLLPILSVPGMREALRTSKAQLVMVANLVNKPAQTQGWHVADYVHAMEQYIDAGRINTVLYNSQEIKPELLQKYAEAGELPVETSTDKFKDVFADVVAANLVANEVARQNSADTAVARTLIRHDPQRVKAEIQKLLAK